MRALNKKNAKRFFMMRIAANHRFGIKMCNSILVSKNKTKAEHSAMTRKRGNTGK
jgi:hypothetical protein